MLLCLTGLTNSGLLPNDAEEHDASCEHDIHLKGNMLGVDDGNAQMHADATAQFETEV